ncbi:MULTISPECIES: AAA family ATPase [unclassified Bradyrhizobium]|uniref:AAA family ATPase n=1 Tax=unclassified Bradyrhizobium TaxID=2631580 RepID=UPI0028F12AF8|nr:MULTISPECIES: AAA family ATPase [unclassified Bradyrhizobium]
MPNDASPVLRSFRLVGLHKYKTIRLDFESQAKIVIAENGAGKTIFLSALDAFLKTNFGKLADLDFERIECELAGASGPLVLYRTQLPTIPEEIETGVNELAHYANVRPTEVQDLILDYKGADIREIPILNRAYMNSPWSIPEIQERVNVIHSALSRTRSPEIKELVSSIKDALGHTDVLYLPTYRRIELAIQKRHSRRLSATIPRPRSAQGLWESFETTMGINYGLADVEARLLQLTELIQRRSNRGYREISAAIIDDLLGGRFPSGDWQSESLPTIDSLRLFFSRIEQSANDAEQRLDIINQLYRSGEIGEQSHQPLRYFLARLSKVVNQTKELESDIENFVNKANEYLSMSGDRKKLRYEPTQMKVKVLNEWTGKDIQFDDLSSGEKQVISLFAHLYLSRTKKIVLIDEPELSLSIDWQKRLLPDVIHSPTCRQLLAITHSPFVFDNELDAYASPFNVTRDISGKMSN